MGASSPAWRDAGVVLLGAFLILLSTAIALAVLWRSREDSLATWQHVMGSFSATVAEHATQSLRTAEFTLERVIDQVKAHGVDSEEALRRVFGTRQMHELLSERAAQTPVVDVIAIAGTDGSVINFNLKFPAPAVNISDREHFRAFMADPELDFHLSAPFRNRTTGRWTFYISRKIRAASGDMIGLALVGIETAYFERFYQSINLSDTESAILLLRSDATLLTRYPPRPQALGMSYRNAPSMQALKEAQAQGRDAAVVRTSEPRPSNPTDSRPRMSAAHAVASFPLLVSVTANESLLLANWGRTAWFIGVGTLVLDGVIVASTLWIARLLRRRRTALQQIEAARVAAQGAHAAADAARQAAENASQVKSRFLATMSHEFRTPLNAVIGLSELLRRRELTQDVAHYIGHIHQAGEQLLALTNDVLDLSRIEAGEMRLEVVPFELPALLDGVRAMVQSQADAKRLALRLTAPADLPVRVLGDPLRLRQVLLNLLGNAVKFTPAGSVELGVRQLASDGMRITLRFDVVDTGIGIAPEHHLRIFEAFTQADSSATRRFGGTGLGLSIVQRLVHMMGGTLALDSTPGQGSTFAMILSFEVPGSAC